MSAITTQINALWRIVHGRSTATVPKIERLDRNNVECVEQVRPSQRNFAEEERYVNRHDFETARIPGRRLWRLDDSNTEIELDKVHDTKPKLDLDLRIPPRVRPQHTAPGFKKIQKLQIKRRFNRTLYKTMTMKEEGKKLLKEDLKKDSKEVNLRIDILPTKRKV